MRDVFPSLRVVDTQVLRGLRGLRGRSRCAVEAWRHVIGQAFTGMDDAGRMLPGGDAAFGTKAMAFRPKFPLEGSSSRMIRLVPRLALAGLILTAAASVPATAQVSDDFQSYVLGTLPSPTWYDAGAVLPGYRVPGFPSGYIVNTFDKHGNATQAVATTSDLADSKGIFAYVPISNLYSLFADVRVDQYSNNAYGPASDWAIQLTFGQNGVSNWAYTPQAGIYASSLTGGWRLYVVTNSVAQDIDLGIQALTGTWYTVAQSLNVTTGEFHSRIWDGATGTSLLDQYNLIAGWNPADAQFDAFAFIGGELTPEATIGNIALIDNVNITAVTTPEPGTLLLALTGILPLVAISRRRSRIQ